MAGGSVKNCKTTAEIVATYREARARLYGPRAISVQCQPPPPPRRLVIEAPPVLTPGFVQFITPPLKAADIQKIMSMVADDYGVTFDDLTGDDLRFRIVRARFIAVFLAHHFTHASTRVLGRKFRRDHSTIVNVLHRMADLLVSDERLASSAVATRDIIINRFNSAAQ